MPAQTKRGFLSYSSLDTAVAEPLVHALKLQGLDLWFSKEKVGGGAFYASEIERAISAADVLLLLASQHSIGGGSPRAAGSKHVQTEIELAVAAGKLIIPLLLDAKLLSGPLGPGFKYQLTRYQCIDISPAIAAGRYQVVCEHIYAALGCIDLPVPPTVLGTPHLDAAERQIAENQWAQARESLRQHRRTGADLHRVRYLEIVAELQRSAPLHRLPKPVVDEYVQQLNALRGTSEEPAVLYLLGVLSQMFYGFNGLLDPTGGLAKLKQQARAAGRLTAKTLYAVRPLLSNSINFELIWKQ